MSNPYTSPSLTGYNSSPPSDDGSQSSSNQVEWAKHITKIGDPIKTYAAAIDAAALAAFGNSFGAGVLAKTASYTVATTDRGRFITFTGTSTATLPVAADAGTGFPVAIVNVGSAIVTVDGDSSETINGSTSLSLAPNEFAILTSNGAAWTAVGNYSVFGSFTPTFAGFSTDPSSPTIYYSISGGTVTVRFNFTTGTSDSNTFWVNNVPTIIRPANTQKVPIAALEDAGVVGWGLVDIQSNAIWAFKFQGDTSSSWTPSGTKGFNAAGATITYRLFTQ